ncbi:sulfatase [Vibrio navarrensis]|nr:sulfatase [Vibrio navarrensis]
MKAVILMFDTLRRDKLPNYNPSIKNMPNFQRLGERTVKFDNFYVGSLPCMPARRDLHTGRLNFLHRSWGPLEPFDDSIFEMLKKEGVYTHLITDHQHYWEDGGATYHNRYNSYEFVRGQEGDLWKAKIGHKGAEKLESYQIAEPLRQNMIHHDQVNRSYIAEEKDYPQAQCYQLGLEFLEQNHNEDNWLLQIESFDPHEPFFVPDRFKKMVDPDLVHSEYDWPEYSATEEINNPKKVADGEKNYQALMLMCDEYLGKILDYFDEKNLWEDTMLVINTDHGFLFGEKEWSGKSVMPVYNELANVPFFMWNPKLNIANETRYDLAQIHDLSVSLLDYFEIEKTKHMTGQSLQTVIADSKPINDEIIFGYFGAHVSVTDGRYVYMRASAKLANQPLYEYTLMPMRMRRMFNKDELQKIELDSSFSFTDHIQVMKIPGSAGFYSSYSHGNLLFDLKNDPNQETPIIDSKIESKMMKLLSKCMFAAEAPVDEFRRLGLPLNSEEITEELVSYERGERERELKQILGRLYSLDMHVDTKTLLLEIAANGGEQMLKELETLHSKSSISREDIISHYNQYQYSIDLSPLFNKAY